MSPETENQLVGAIARLADQLERQLTEHDRATQIYLVAQERVNQSAQRLHDLRAAHSDLEFLLEHKRLPTLGDAFGLSAIPSEIQQRITDALLAPAVMQAAADAAESVREATPFEHQTPPVYAETADGEIFEVGKGEELKDGSQPFDRVEILRKQREDRNWADLDVLIARLCETEPRAKILAATRRAYDAAKADM